MNIKSDIGGKIKEIRTHQQLDVTTLAQRANLDPKQIELIEEQKVVPGLSPIIKIARVLGISLSELIDEYQQTDPVVCVAGEAQEGISFSNKNVKARSHMNFYPLAENKEGRHMEPFFITIDAANNDYQLSSHEGEEFIYVLSGSIEINYGKDVYVLNQGDSIYYDSVVDHNVHVYKNESAKILAVVYTPLV